MILRDLLVRTGRRASESMDCLSKILRPKPSGIRQLELVSMEDRVLFSAAPGPAPEAPVETVSIETAPLIASEGPSQIISDGTAAQSPETPDSLSTLPSSLSELSTANVVSRELVFLDTGIEDYQDLLDDLWTHQDPDRHIDIVLISTSEDVLSQITETLAQYRTEKLDAIHLVTHGSTNGLQLGNTWLDSTSLSERNQEIATWREALNPAADLLVYGCNLAESDQGQSLLTQLVDLTGADVSASSDVTGHSSLGGDWELEYVQGRIESGLVFSADAVATWYGTLDLTAPGGETLVNGSTSSNQNNTPDVGQHVAMDSSGDYVVTWFDDRSGNWDAYARVYNADGTARTGEFLVHTANSATQDWANVAMADNGIFVVTWSDFRSGNFEVYMRLFDVNGTALTGETLVSTLSGTQDYHTADFAADGSFVIAFQNATDNNIYFQRYNASGVAQGGNTVANNLVSGIQNRPDITVRDDGSFIITWNDDTNEGNGSGIYARMFNSSGTALANQFLVNSYTTGNQHYSSIDSDSSGNFVISWTSASQDGSGDGIYFKRYNSSGAAQSGDVLANTTTANEQRYSHVDMNADGEFIIAWEDNSNDSGTAGIFAQQFTSVGTRYGSQILVNSTSTGSQLTPAVAYTGNSAVVTWTGNGVGDSNGIFARRFSTSSGPTITVPGAQTTSEDTNLVFSSGLGNLISISDPDAASNAIEVTVSVTQGDLTLSGTTNLTFSTGDGINDATMTFRGSVTAINTALNGLIYRPAPNASGSATLTIQSLDNTLVSLNFDTNLQGRYTFEGNASDVAPGTAQNGSLLNGASIVTDTTRGQVLNLDGVDDNIQISGTYSISTEVTIGGWVNLGSGTGRREFISLDDRVHIALDDTFGVKGSIQVGAGTWVDLNSNQFIAGTGWHHVMYTFSDSTNVHSLYVDGVQVATATIASSIYWTGATTTYIGRHPSGSWYANARMDDVRIYNRALAATEVASLAGDLGLTDSSSVAISVSAVNDAPTFTSLNGSPTYIENGSGVRLDADVTISDPELSAANDFTGATLTLARHGGVNSQDQLAFDGLTVTTSGANLYVSGVQVGTYTFTGGQMTITLGAGSTQARVNTLMQNIYYWNTSDSPPSSVQLDWTFSDGNSGTQGSGGALVATGSTTVSMTAVNDAPVLDNSKSPVLTSGAEDSGAPSGAVGTLVSSLVDFASPAGRIDNVTDADSSSLLGIAVIAADSTNGNWFYSINGGTTWNALGAVTSSNARLLAADANTRIYFQPNANWSGTLANAITFRAWDQSSGVNGAAVNIAPPTYLDQFNSTSYSNNNGTLSWTGSWVETDNNGGGASGGNIRVNSNELRVQSDRNLDNVYRIADLSSFSAATLSFDYDNTISSSIQDKVEVQLSSNGGASYSTIATFDGLTNTGTGSASFDITSFIASNTRLRIIITKIDTSAPVYFDNIQITGSPVTGGITAYSTATDTASLVVTAVNDVPTITTNGTALAYAENQTATAVDSALTVSDVDNANLTGATVTISSNYVSGQDLLAFTDQLGITGSWNASTGVLTLSGTTTVANYQAALRSITYFNTSDSPSTLVRTVSFVVSDGAANSPTATRTITVTAVNDAPQINSSSPLNSINEDDTSNTGTLVSSLIATSSSDADSGALQGIAITSVDTTHGTWEYTLNGTTWMSMGTPSATAALLLPADVTTAVRFVPQVNFNGNSGLLYYRAWDQTTGTAGGTADVTVNGGTTAFSSGLNGTSVSISAINDAPVITAPGSITATEGDEYYLGSDLQITDPDATTVEVRLEVTRGGITFWTLPATGITFLEGDGHFDSIVRMSGSVTDINNALADLFYQPGVTDGSPASMTVDVSDLGGTGQGGILTDSKTVQLLVTMPAANAGDAFLQGNYLEIGFSTDGSLGSEGAAPTGYNSAGGYLGAEVDPQQDGWATFDGDFVTPGNPVENWGINIGGTNYDNSNGSSGVAGSFTSAQILPTGQQATWTGSQSGLNVVQTYTVGSHDLYFDVVVQLTNTTGLGMTDVYYYRNVDPDNNFDQGSTNYYDTTNTIISQGNTSGLSLVTATQAEGSFLGLMGFGSNSRVSYGGFYNSNPVDMYNGTGGMNTSGTNTADEGVSLAFYYSSIAAGETQTLHFRYYFASGAAATPEVDLDANDSSGVSNGGFQTTFTENGGAVAIVDSDATVILPSGSNLDSMTVTISNILDGALEQLAVDTTGTGITASYNSGTGVLSLTGSATTAEYTQVLRTVTYNNLSENPDTSAVRQITVIASNGIHTSSVATSSLTVNAVNDAPAIATNTMTIGEGGTVVLTSSELSAADPDHNPSQLVYSVSGVTHGQFELVSSPGTAITSFTQAQINSGAVQFVHDGGESAPSYSVSVSDGLLSSGTSSASITFANINDAPTLTAISLTISEGGTVVLSNADIDTSDPDNSATQLTYAVTSVSGGHFESIASGATVTSFTQSQINNGGIQFVHDGGESAPTFSLTVSDGFVVVGPVAATINFTNTNDAPVITANSLTIFEGGTVVLSSSNINSADPDNTPAQLTYSVTGLSGGQFELVSVPGTAITSFTQAQINGGAVQFVHNGGELAPSYTLTVIDGSLTSGASAATITFTNVNDAPAITANVLSINEGGTVILSSASISASDPDNTAAQLTYTASGISGGQFELASAPGSAITSFTQAQINNGSVRFVHDGGEAAPTYSLTVSDGTLSHGPISAIVNFTNVNDAPVTGTASATANEDVTPVGVLLGGTDVDGTITQFQISSLPSTGTLYLDAAGTTPLVAGSNYAATGGQLIVYFVPAANWNGSTSFDFTAIDNVGTIDATPATATININATNDPPVLTMSSVPVDFTENNPVGIATDLTVIDVDSTSLSSATITLISGFMAGEDQLIFTDMLGITGNYNATTGVLSLTGTASLTSYQTALQSVAYWNPSDNPITTQRQFQIVVSDGFDTSSPVTRAINIHAINDAPVIATNTLTISEGGTVVLSSTDIASTDPDNTNSQLSYSVSTLSGGQFELVSAPGVAITSFTQAQINSGSVQFVHDGGEAAPGYTLILNDGTASSSYSSATITFTNLNDAPVITTNTLVISEGGTVVLTGTEINSSDPDTAASGLTYTVSNLTGGHFESVATGNTISSFTQSQINSGGVRFVHDGGEAAPVYSLSVSDGLLSNGPSVASITFSNVNDAPVITSNTLTISEGGTVVLSSANINASDPDNSAAQLTYTVSNLSGGRFELVASPGTAITSFIQAQINSGAVQFVHDGGDAAPSYQLTLSDGSLSTGPSSVAVTFTPVNDAPTITTILDQTVNEDTVLGPISFTVSDSDSASLIVNATSSDGILIPPGNVVLAGTGNNRTVTITPASNLNGGPVTITLTVSDGTLSAQTSFTVTVSAVNDAPAISSATFAVTENAANGTLVGTALAADIDLGDTQAFSITSGDPAGAFTINSLGQITVADGTLLDFETQPNWTLTVQVRDAAGATASALVTIKLLDQNDNTPAILSNGGGASAALSLSENSTGVTTTIATDADAGTAIVYSLTGADAALFQIDSNTGVLSFLAGPDFESPLDSNGDNVYAITVIASDGLHSDSQDLAISVTDVNEFATTAISDLHAASETVSEGASVGTSVGITASADDLDGTDTVSYSLLNNAGGLFAIDSTTGVVTVAGTIDYETATNHTIRVQALSTDGSSTFRDFTIAVTDVNEFATSPISDLNAAVEQVAENVAVGTAVGITAFADDLDGTDTISYSLLNNAGGRFAIDATTGVVTVAGAIDYETATSHTIRVQALSTDGSSTFHDFTIAVTDVNEFTTSAISDLNAATDTVAENAAVGTAVGITAFADDLDGTDTISYSLLNNAGGRFAIDATTGVVTVAGAIDYETATSHTIRVQALSTDGSSTFHDFTIAVTDVNEFTITAISDANAAPDAVSENSPIGTVVGVTAFASDADGTDTVGYSLDANAGGAVTIDPVTGVVKVNGTIDYESTSQLVFTVRATSTDGSFATRTFTVSVIDQNDNAPVITSGQTFLIPENSAIGTHVGVITVSDADTTGLLQNWQIVGGTGAGAFALNGSTGQVTVANSSLLNFETSTSFTLLVTVSDGLNTSTVQTVTILLSDVNEQPVLLGNSFNVTENSPAGTFVGALTATDPDAGDQLSYSIIAGNAGGAFAVDPTTGVIRVSNPALLDFETSPVFTLTAQVTDRGGLSHQQTITISLQNENEIPTVIAGTFHIAEWSTAGTAAGIVAASDVDAGDTLTFQIAAGNTGGRFLIDSTTGEIRLADPAQFTFESQSSFTLTVQVQDQGGLTSVAQMIVQVDNVNAPPIAADDLYSLVQFQALMTTPLDGVRINDSDPDSPALMVTLISGPTNGILILNPDGTFSYTSTGMFSGVDSFTYQLSDGLETSQIATVTLTVGMVAPGGGGDTSGDDSDANDDSDQTDSEQDFDSTPTGPGQVISGMLTVSYTPTTHSTGNWSNPDGPGLATTSTTQNSGNILSPIIVPTQDHGGYWIRKHSRSPVRPNISAVLPDSVKTLEAVPQTLPDISVTILENGVMWNQLNHLRDSLQEQQRSAALMENIVVGTTTAIGGGLTVGYVIWLIRGGSLLATMMSIMPTWISFDPLPVMDQFEEEHLEEDTESLASIVSGRR